VGGKTEYPLLVLGHATFEFQWVQKVNRSNEMNDDFSCQTSSTPERLHS